MSKPNVMLELWYRALSSPFGIEVQCHNLTNIRTRLYIERSKIKDADLETISLCQSPFDDTKLWMVKTKRKPE